MRRHHRALACQHYFWRTGSSDRIPRKPQGNDTARLPLTGRGLANGALAQEVGHFVGHRFSMHGARQGVSLSVAPSSHTYRFFVRSVAPGQVSAGHLSMRATTVSVPYAVISVIERQAACALDGRFNLFRAVPPCVYGSSTESRFLHP